MSSSKEEFDVRQHIHGERIKRLLGEAAFLQDITTTARKEAFQKYKVKLEENFTRLVLRTAAEEKDETKRDQDVVAAKESAEELRKRL